MSKQDPRTIRTKQMIKDATLQLLREGCKIHQLTVQQITKQANLNRTTFYLHYIDIYDLTDALANELSTHIQQKVEPLIETNPLNSEEQLVHLLQFFKTEREQLLLLFQPENLEALLHELFLKLITVRRERSRKLSKNAMIEADIKAASLVGIIMWWFKHGQRLDAHYIAEQIQLMYKK